MEDKSIQTKIASPRNEIAKQQFNSNPEITSLPIPVTNTTSTIEKNIITK
jgi:hypothetical protein